MVVGVLWEYLCGGAAVVGGLVAVLKTGCFIVEVVEEDVIVRWAVGRRFACDGRETIGDSGAGYEGALSKGDGEGRGLAVIEGEEGAAPSNGDGEGSGLAVTDGDGGTSFSTSGAGVTRGEAGGVSSLLLAALTCLDGDAGILKLLLGLANGLVARSPLWLICDGRLTNGLAFSGDREPARVYEGFVGDCVGVVARAVAGDMLFCRLNGLCRPVSKERGEGRRGFAWCCQ